MTQLAPQVSEGDAYEAASRLRRTSSLAEVALQDLADGAAPSWWGGASEAYYASRGRVSGRLTTIDTAACRLANAIDAYAADASAAATRWRQAQADRDTAVAQPSIQALTDPTLVGVAVAQADADSAHAQHEYRQAVTALSREAQWTLDVLDDVRGIDDHIGEGIEQFVRTAVMEPVAAAVTLGFGWIKDPEGWKDQVAAIPSGLWHQVTHPRQTVGELAGEAYWRDGDWGAGAGTALAGGMGLVSLRHLARDQRQGDRDNDTEPAGNTDVPDGGRDAPAPPLLPQTTDELLAGVRLRRQETHPQAHTLKRHVDVSTGDIIARYTNAEDAAKGTTQGTSPKSRFYDLPTAEGAIDETLRHHQAAVRSLAASRDPAPLRLTATLDDPVGEIAYRDTESNMQVVAGRTVVVVLRRDPHGDVFVLTAYVEAS